MVGLLDAEGTQVVSYKYNSWGDVLTWTDTSEASVGQINPFKYRGYFADTGIGMYYVGSRYYDPETGRWVNADITGVLMMSLTDLIDKNIYAYCDNNPVMRMDVNGQIWTMIAIGLSVNIALLMIEEIVTGERTTNGEFLMCLVGGIVGGAVKTLNYGDDAINVISRVTNGFCAGIESLLSGGDTDDYLVAVSLGVATGNEIEIKGANNAVNETANILLDKAASNASSMYAQSDNGSGGIKHDTVVDWWNAPLKKANLENVPTYGINGVSSGPKQRKPSGITGLFGSALVRI